MPDLAHARYSRLTRLEALDAIEIAHPHFHAVLTLQGAQLVRFAPAGATDWLWLSPRARFEPGRAIRGGIPVCWPWFGDPARNPPSVKALLSSESPPAHGLARTAIWTLEELHEAPEQVTMVLALEAPADARWQGAARACLECRFRADALVLELTTDNTGDRPLAITQALHTYLPTPDITRSRVRGFEGVAYVDTLNEWRTAVQSGAVVFRGETDRIYQAAPALNIEHPHGVWHLNARGSGSTVVWNPGPEKARRLSDFPDHAWTGMLCVETANAGDDYRELPPGQRHSMAMTLTRN
ncbi:MAG: D-hexose-6-phosphate mutarotase [Marinobacter sp.]